MAQRQALFRALNDLVIAERAPAESAALLRRIALNPDDLEVKQLVLFALRSLVAATNFDR